MSRQWFGTYAAVVHSAADPARKGRVTLKIPQVLGKAISQWAPAVSVSGSTPPPAGTAVTAMFLGGDVSHPVYLQAVTTGAVGTATLTGGTATVSTTLVADDSCILLTAQDNNSAGALRVSARTAGESFTITSSSDTDSGVVAYQILAPG